MSIRDYFYKLPEKLIAQEPLEQRDSSRMLVADRSQGEFYDAGFTDLPKLLKAGDVIVLNNTKVFPARLLGKTETGAAVETFLVKETGRQIWEVLARPGRRLKLGKKIRFGERLSAEVLEKRESGNVVLRFSANGDFDSIVDLIGRTPLPPYIKRDADASDRERYQTVFARSRGAIAAPTAGLHFTPEMLKRIADSGITVVEITLHVGYGTFEPVRVSDLSKHNVLPESFEIDQIAADILNRAKAEKRRIIAVGTTTTRALETSMSKRGRFVAEKEVADLTIRPGYVFKAIDGLLTNFHLPESSLLVLVSTFGGRELIMKAYKHAVAASYRFYSYGDCMLII